MFFDDKPYNPGGTSARGTPSTYGEMFEETVEAAHKAHNPFARDAALESAYDQHIDRVFSATGKRFENPMRQLLDPVPGIEAPAMRDPSSQMTFSIELKKLADERPELRDIIQPDRNFLEDAAGIQRSTLDRESDVLRRAPSAAGGFAMQIAGGLTAGLVDPLYYGTMMLGPIGGVGVGLKPVLMHAAKIGALNAGIATAALPLVADWRKQAGLELTTGEAATNVATAFIFGAGADAGIRGLARGMNRARGKVPMLDGDGAVSGWQNPPRADAAPALPPLPELPPDLVALAAQGDQAAMADIAGRTAKAAEPVLPKGVTPSMVEKAAGGDIAAIRTIAEKTGAIDDPVVKGAIDTAELAGPFDAETKAYFKANGIDDGEGMAALAKAIRAASDPDELPPVHGPEALAKGKALTPGDGDAIRAELGNELQALKAALGQTDPRLAGLVDDAVDAGISDALPIIRAHAEAIAKGQDPAKAAASFAGQMVELGGDNPAALLSVARIASGRAKLPEITRYLRSGGQLDNSIPITGPVRMAQSLARLSDDAYAMVETGEAKAGMAAMVADRVADPSLHASALADLAKVGVDDPAIGARVLPDLLPHPGRAANDILLGVRRSPETAEMPLRAGAEVDDPAGPAAKKQTERLAAELAPEIKQALAEGPPPVLPPKTAQDAILRANEVRQAISDITGIVPPETRVEVFSHASELPASAQAGVARANGVLFADAMRRLMGSVSEDQRALARADLDAIKDGQGVEAIAHDGTIWIASYAMNPKGRIAHEVVHALKTLGKLSREELAILAGRARKTVAFPADREANYRAELEQRGWDQARVAETLDEEAAAHLIEARQNGTSFGREINGVLDRIKRFFEMAGNALRLRGFRTADDVVESVLTGEAAKRDPKGFNAERPAVDVEDAMFAMRDSEQPQTARSPDFDPESVARQGVEMMQPYLSRNTGISLERDADGTIAYASRDGERYAINRDEQGQITGMVPADQEAAAPLVAMITTAAKENYGVGIAPERASAIAAEVTGILRNAPENPAVAGQAISNLITRVMDELSAPEPMLNAGVENGVPSPLRQDLAGINRLTEIGELVSVCR